MAVAFAIRNRVNAGFWGGDWASVLSHHKDYSSVSEQPPYAVPDPRIYSIQCLLQEIDGIFKGSRADDITIPRESVLAKPAPPALYYGRLDQITSSHFLENIARKPDIHPRVAQVGMLTFFA